MVSPTMHQPQPAPRTRHQQRDRAILDHVARHRITIRRLLRQLFFPGTNPAAATKVTTRLCRHGRLARHVLCHPRVYFTLGPREARDRGLSPSRAEPLGPQALPSEYAAVAYATFGAVMHRRLTTDELAALFPWTPPALAEVPHCLDESGQPPVLERIRVDLGGTPDHVARRCDADLADHRRLREFSTLLTQRRFRLVVVTGTPQKAVAIKEAIGRHAWPEGLRVHLAVVPDLLLLTARLNDGP